MKTVSFPNYTYQEVIFDLSTARNLQYIGSGGNLIKCIDASDIDSNMEIRLNETGNDAITVKKGRSVSGWFNRFYITNTAQAGKTITLVIATTDAVTIRDDGIVGDIDTISTITNPIAVKNIPNSLFNHYDGLGKNPVYVSDRITLDMVAGASKTLYTVGAGKIFNLFYASFSLMVYSSTWNHRGYLYIDDTGVDEYLHYMGQDLQPTNNVGVSIGNIFQPQNGKEIVITAGKSLSYYADTEGGTDIFVIFRGLLIDA
jgi:hypothetical protein